MNNLPRLPRIGWLEFRLLNMSCGWFYPAVNSSSGGWIQVAADFILRLTLVLTAGYEWLRLTTSCGWFYPVADSSSASWTRLTAELYFNISSKFKDLFCKIHYFYGLFSTPWFQTLVAASINLKKLEEAWRSFKTLAATDSSCSDWFELWRLIRNLRPIDYLQSFDPDVLWYQLKTQPIIYLKTRGWVFGTLSLAFQSLDQTLEAFKEMQ